MNLIPLFKRLPGSCLCHNMFYNTFQNNISIQPDAISAKVKMP